ncbi:hypothetical protein [Rufibacter roseus]|uniref:DUF3098 domain-containing protein n=1 Tax=Rufibacter roseus TaxID=1567108 RepID=A0ABW2DMX9_9BACT|nr:hypothetical protein [Rufibacter roseus]
MEKSKVNGKVILGYVVLVLGLGLLGYCIGYMIAGGSETNTGFLISGLTLAFAGGGLVYYGVKAVKR